jgi:hypothetical protein
MSVMMSAVVGNVSFVDAGDVGAVASFLTRAVGELSVWGVLVTLLAVAVVYDQCTLLASLWTYQTVLERR